MDSYKLKRLQLAFEQGRMDGLNLRAPILEICKESMEYDYYQKGLAEVKTQAEVSNHDQHKISHEETVTPITQANGWPILF
jgi:hypothetical protein